MLKKSDYIRYFCKNKIRVIKRKLRFKLKPATYKKEILPDSSNYIKEIIYSKKPAMICRFGANEGAATAEGIAVKLGLKCKKRIMKRVLTGMHKNAGLFPYGADSILRFSDIIVKSALSADVIGYWEAYMQDYLIDCVCRKDVKLIDLKELEPYYSDEPWSEALSGLKVVVVHPFSNTIEKQYAIRTKLFSDKRILPDFSLRTVKAVQSSAYETDNRFKDWFEALEYMFNEVMKEDFDVAIIGCGAYGFPLAAKIKEAGKIAIHMGGATQILFGIKGKRWDSFPEISRFYNDYWVRPSDEDKPKKAELVEGGCYW